MFPLLSADVPPAGPMDLPLSLLEMGCSGRFELITHPVPGLPLPPQSTVSMLQDDLCEARLIYVAPFLDTVCQKGKIFYLIN